MNLPKNTFGASVGKAAASAAAISFPFAFEGGTPGSSLLIGGIAGGVAAVNHLIRSVHNTNETIKYQKAADERRAIREAQKSANAASRTESLGRQLKNYNKGE